MHAFDLREIGLAQRMLVWGFLAGILSVVPILLLVTIPFLLICVWRITSALRLSIVAKVFCVLLMVIPIISAITLLVLSSMATRVLKAGGIKVGLMGVKVSDLPFVDEIAPDGTTPLMMAAMLGKAEKVSALVAAGADIDATDEHGWTPLMFAANRNEPKVVKTLLEHGANISHVNEDNKSAIDLANDRNNIEIMEIMRLHIATKNKIYQDRN